ncbi:hypothetical protein [Flavobacterium sp. PS2]|uniref:hypothetical protein n=1 Tax=Flavobacterium sp. PS2 TaxID=3384157 RepID=UPI00390C958F
MQCLVLPTLVAGGNPLAGLIFSIMKNQIMKDINEFNAYIAKHIEEVETQKRLRLLSII